MNGLWWFLAGSLFGAPFVAFGVFVAMCWLASIQERIDEERHG